MAFGKSIRLFLAEGIPTGIRTAEIVNWTGHLLLAPRSKLSDVMKRPESGRTGLYFLFGDYVDVSQKRQVYIGESDNVGKRIAQHSRSDDKEFESFCIVTSKDLNLTKAHGRYLEGRVTSIAKEAGRFHVLNSNEPPIGVLPEADIADMEGFIDQLKVILPVLGYDLLREVTAAPQRAEAIARTMESAVIEGASPTELELELSTRRGMTAEAVERDGEYVVRKGSTADASPQHAVNIYADLRQRLIDDGDLAQSANPKLLQFTRDIPFSSPSAAAAVIYGRNSNGRTAWKVKGSNQTLKEYQDARVEDTA